MPAPVDEIAAIGVEVARISDLIRQHDLATPVPHLGRWKVRDVAAHLGGVHRWATRTIVERSRDVPGYTKSKLDGAELCNWFDEGAEELLDVLHSNELHEACPNFNPGSPKTIGWWARRQMHETTVHRWDIEQALDCTTPVDPNLAADGVDEFLDVFVRTRGKQTLTAPLVLTSIEPEQSWTITPASKPGRVDTLATASSGDLSAILGPPDQLLLFLWGRLTLDTADLSIIGDDTVARSFKELPAS